jgi:signal transduction histidine kinase
VFLHDGKLVTGSKSLGNGSLTHPTPPLGKTVTNALMLPDGQMGRQATLTFLPVFEEGGKHLPGKVAVTVTVARHTGGLAEKLTGLAWLLVAVGAAATLGAAGAMFFVVNRGLRPLGQLAAHIGAMGSDDLGERIELADTPAELSAVVLRLNEMLERLQATFLRERRFTADAAHELRTPLAGLETILDVCATRARSSEEYVKTLAKCQRISQGMHAMVDSLMTLARVDSRQLAVTMSRVPLAAMVQEAWTTCAGAAAAKGLRVGMKIDPQLCVETDAEKLRMIVNNLLDNAVSHSDAKGWVRIEGKAVGNDVALSVSNSGSTLNEEQVRRAFDRFWRGDAARRDTGLHCGLGLSLCSELTAVLSGEIAAVSEPGGVFLVRVVLPGRAEAATQTRRDDSSSAADRLASISA